MAVFLQATGLVFVGVILVLVVGKQSRDLSLLLSLGICAGLCAAAGGYLQELMGFLGELRALGNLDRSFLSILLKCAGIGYISEIAALLCADAGEQAMAKAMQILASGAVLYLSLPLMRELVGLIREVLGWV